MADFLTFKISTRGTSLITFGIYKLIKTLLLIRGLFSIAGWDPDAKRQGFFILNFCKSFYHTPRTILAEFKSELAESHRSNTIHLQQSINIASW